MSLYASALYTVVILSARLCLHTHTPRPCENAAVITGGVRKICKFMSVFLKQYKIDPSLLYSTSDKKCNFI